MRYNITLYRVSRDGIYSDALYETHGVQRVDIGTIIDENIMPFLADAEDGSEHEISVEAYNE